MVQRHNWDIQIKRLAAKAAYFAMKAFDAKKMMKVELQGNFGLAGERQRMDTHLWDLEKEHGAEIKATIPWGPNTVDYRYTRRAFGPTSEPSGRF